MPEVRDPLQWQSPYWDNYGNLTYENKQEIEVIKEIVEETKEVVPYVPQEVSDQSVIEYLCEKVQMDFLSNPSSEEVVYQTECNANLIEDKFQMHFNLGKELKFKGTETDTFTTKRTDDNYQIFRISFDKDLEFLDVFKQEMFFREQNPQFSEPDIPVISSQEEYISFISDPSTYRLYESEDITLGQTFAQTTNLMSVPFQNKSLSVAKYQGYKLLDRWPM